MKTLIISLTIVLNLILAGAVQAQQQDAPGVNPHTGDFTFPGDVAVLPLSDAGSHPMIQVDFGEGKTYRFIVDTGASLNVIDGSIAEELSFEKLGITEIGAPGGNQVPGDIVLSTPFKLENGTVQNAQFVTMDISGLTMGMAQGVIGTSLFRDYLLTYDLKNQEIRVSKQLLTEDDPDVVPFTLSEGHNLLDAIARG